MPSFYGKQPNGRYFRYSSIVDSFTSINMTRDEALADAIRECGEDAGLRKIERADRDENAESYDPRAPMGLRRWFGCTQWMVICKGHPNDDDPHRAAKERELLSVLEMVRAGSQSVPTPPVKVTLGYVVKHEGRYPYLTARPYQPATLAVWWTREQSKAVRMSRSLARWAARHEREQGRTSTRVVRLVRTIETPLPAKAE